MNVTETVLSYNFQINIIFPIRRCKNCNYAIFISECMSYSNSADHCYLRYDGIGVKYYFLGYYFIIKWTYFTDDVGKLSNESNRE